MWIIVFIGSFLVPSLLGQSCNYEWKIGANPLKISSPNYPENYKPGSACEWKVTAYADYKIQLTCTDVNIPNTLLGDVTDRLTGGLINICAPYNIGLMRFQPDYMQVSPKGSDYYEDATTYCGTDSFTVTSVSNTMNIRFKAQPKSSGGRYTCTLKRIVNPCNCGRHKKYRIYGGQNADLHDYPMLAVIVDAIKRELYCGATIISPRFALTAAQCISGRDFSKIGLVVGEYDISKGTDTEYTALHHIESTRIYPYTIQNGVGLVKTVKEIELNVGVALACLPFQYKYDSFTGSKVEVEGWGSLEYGGLKPNILQKVQLDVVDLEMCRPIDGSVTSNNNLCTYTPGKGLCDFDSGNGLLYTDYWNGRVHVIGVVVGGKSCIPPISPDISMRVTSFLEWIQMNSEGFEYCNTVYID